MDRLLKQIVQFVLVSGTGWLLDLGIYLTLTYYYDFSVWAANILGALPAATFVFIVSTRKIFANNIKRLTLRQKYAIYILYQILLILGISLFGQYLYNMISTHFSYEWLLQSAKLIVKLFITCITIVLNFMVMKVLVEKL